MKNINVLYRMSTGCGRRGPDYLNNESCFMNFKSAFPNENIYVVLDNADESCENIMKHTNTSYEKTKLGNFGSYNRLLDIAVEKANSGEYKMEDVVYFVENDYIHRPESNNALLEGIEISDYVTLYDHPDKYINLHGNMHVCGVQYSDIRSQLFAGDLCYWRTTTSTCATFAARVSTILEDIEIHRRFMNERTGANDTPIFHHLIMNKQRRLVSPMPGYATHGDMFSPYVEWESILNKVTQEKINLLLDRS